MTRHSSLSQARSTLLDSLGLPPDASKEELTARRTELRASLKSAPASRTEWIKQQIARVDAVLALDAAGEPAGAQDAAAEEGPTGEDAANEPDPDDPVALDEIDEVAERRRAARKAARRTSVTGVDATGTTTNWNAKGRNSSGKSGSGKAGTTSSRSSGSGQAGRGRQKADVTSWVARIVIVALVVAVVLAVYKLGAPSSSSANSSAADMSASASATPTLDEAQVAELEQKVKDNPQDTDSMGRLASLYAAVGDYANASTWQAKVVELKPDDADAQLTLGVSCFNNGDLDCAKEHWDIVARLDPNRAEVHFDLGYYYLSVEPPDIDKVKEEWNKVIELDPDGQYAQTVKTHMDSLDKTTTPTPSATATP